MDIIESAFKQMISRLNKSVRANEIPNLYSAVNEVNYVYHFFRALEKINSDTIVYLEFPHDEGRIDGLALVKNAVFLVEAKSYIKPRTITGKGGLEDQAQRLENKNISLYRYIRDRIIKTNDKDWNNNHRIDKVYSILLAAAWEEKWSTWWKNIGKNLNDFMQDEEIPILSSYDKFISLKNETYTKGADPWYHLVAYKKISDSREYFI